MDNPVLSDGRGTISEGTDKKTKEGLNHSGPMYRVTGIIFRPNLADRKMGVLGKISLFENFKSRIGKTRQPTIKTVHIIPEQVIKTC